MFSIEFSFWIAYQEYRMGVHLREELISSGEDLKMLLIVGHVTVGIFLPIN